MEPTGIPTIRVMDTVRAHVQETARQVCKARKVAEKDFNQDLCAITAVKAMATARDNPEWEKASEYYQLAIAKVCSNASALRQSLEAKAAPTSEVDIAAYAALVN